MRYGWQYLSEEEKAAIERGIVENRVFGGPWHCVLQPTNVCNVD